MSEVLSQNEIDALLNALSTGEVDAKEIKDANSTKKVRNYDFRNPQKMAKDQLRTLEIIYDNFSRLLQTFLSGYLRAPVTIQVLSVDQYAYSEFTNAISNPAFLSIIKFFPLPGEIIIDVSPQIAMVMIERLLGGMGEGVSDLRSFTEIELILLRKIVNKMIALMSEAWENIIELRPSLEKIETNPQFAQIISPSETIALITLNISIGEIEGMLNICLPHLVLEPILDQLSTRLWFTTSKSDIQQDSQEHMEKRLKHASVLMKAEIGTSKLAVREILSLRPGDVVTFEDMNDKVAVVRIGTKMKFMCEPGVINNHLAVKINEIIQNGGEVEDE